MRLQAEQIVIGDVVCGKTSLVAKITEGKFINNYHMTIGGTGGVRDVSVLNSGHVSYIVLPEVRQTKDGVMLH